MAKIDVLTCFPVLRRTKKGWEPYVEKVGRHGDGIAYTRGKDVIQVVENGRAQWFDPITGNRLQKTKDGKGLWDEDKQVYRRVIPGAKRRF